MHEPRARTPGQLLDRLLLILAGLVFAAAAWAFWHFLGEGAPAVLITVTVASLMADNRRLRKRLANVLGDGMRPGPGTPEAPDARPKPQPASHRES